jgi:signal transduction histidine kinase
VLRQRSILRTGFVVFLGILILAIVSAYQIQDKYSQQTAELHNRYVQHQKVITDLRRSLWAAGSVARDFFLNTSPDSAAVYSREQARLKTRTESRLQELDALRVDAKSAAELRVRFEDLWSALTHAVAANLTESEEYSFVQREIMPRRDAAGELLREIEKATEESLAASEEEFERSRQMAAKRLMMLLGSSLLIGAVVAFVSLRYSDQLERENVARFEEVSLAKRELGRLSARLMEIQEEERTKLSRELHDEIVQTLAVSKMEVIQAQGKSATEGAEHLARARDLLDKTLRTVRNIALLLRPSLLDDLGLVPALQWQADEFRRRTGVNCVVTESVCTDELPDAINTCVFRVVQEALHNCEKHSKATRVDVNLQMEGGWLKVEVKDDGMGFAAEREAAGPGHLGLIGMRERASGVGGALTLESAPGEGTVVCLRVPYGRVELAAPMAELAS